MQGRQIAGRVILAAAAAGCLAGPAAAQLNTPAEAAGGYESLGAPPKMAVQQQMQSQMKANSAAMQRQMVGQAQFKTGAGQMQMDAAALQQMVDKINTAAVGQQAKNRPDQTSIQQQMQAQMQTNSAAMQQQMSGQVRSQLAPGQGGVQLDPAAQQGMAKKMEGVMRQGLADSGAIQEMRKKIMAEQMQKNLLQESIKPMMMENVQKQLTGGKTTP